MRGKRIVCAAILLLACGLAAAGETTSYPTRPIKMIVPFPPGGPVDVTARILTQHLPQTLGQPVVVENRAGAAGSLGAKAVASADPDGYTLLCGNISTLVVLPAVSNNRDYDPSKAFAPIAKVSQNHEVLVVHPAFAAKSVPELVAYAQANPGKLNYGSAGHGNATHLAAELFKLRTGVDIVHVPYKSNCAFHAPACDCLELLDVLATLALPAMLELYAVPPTCSQPERYWTSAGQSPERIHDQAQPADPHQPRPARAA